MEDHFIVSMASTSASNSTKRSGNFSKEEEQLLVSLVAQNKHIVENKKSGVISWKDKQEAWKRIEAEFNCQNTHNLYRNMKGLKEKYANLKRTTKQKFSKNRQQILKTGGGSCETINFTDIDTTLKDILGEQVDGLNNIYDSDCVQSKKLNFTRFLCVLIFLKLFLIFVIDEVNEGNSAEVRAEVISNYDEIAASTTEPISCEGRYEMLNDKNYKNY
jgi:hypothetical protein